MTAGSANPNMAFRLDFDFIALRMRKLLWMARRRKRRGLLRQRIAPSLEHTDLFAGRSFRSVVDVGANVGQFAIWAADVLGAEQVVCVEPLPAAIAQLREVADRLAPCRVEVIAGALGATSETRTLHVTAAIDSSSLLPVATAAQSRTALRETGTETVDVLIGDEVLPDRLDGPLLIKLDVQGTELDVLAGMPKTLAKADAVLVEVSFLPLYEGQSNPSTVVACLLEAGFVLTGIGREPRSASPWVLDQADLLFERR
ncbi:FkbM family methyltransferase [Mycobacterium sp. IDR2000157661]|uniref:FkbM family methyltransferase n=1 Tax=Mycobacterium sp. IDR2000157661 TaxID=2867005 RepID=UPI001EEC0E4C|nr:FkbM family methyltransferase [Mycobacterium sp. IDR2000157661]ULE33632.1 FkbM family methyltransferase [Mycobacterium sp. IDR2000157661]